MDTRMRVTLGSVAALALGVAVFALGRGERSSPPAGLPVPESSVPEGRAVAQPLVAPVAAESAVAASAGAARRSSARQVIAIDGGPGGRRIPIGDEERVRRRAVAAADELGLSAPEADALVAVLLQEQSRRAAAFRDLRGASDPTEARARVRAELDEVLAWKTRELEARFGSEVAAALLRR